MREQERQQAKVNTERDREQVVRESKIAPAGKAGLRKIAGDSILQ